MQVKKLFIFVKKIIKKILFPIYYSYTGYKIFNLIIKLTGYKEEKQHFFKSLGYHPNIENPRSFNEKVLQKKFYDRNPILPIVSDKFLVRKYLKDVLGEKEAKKILIPLLYETNKPESIPFEYLPEEYIIKANHACRQYILVENMKKQKKYTIVNANKTTKLFDCKKARKEIINICRNWLSMPYGFRGLEWAYQPIKRKIVIEKLLRDSKGKIPADYKFSIIHGKCQLIQVYYDRFVDINRAWYTPEWKYINIKGHIGKASYKQKPENLEIMIFLAELLGKSFDFIRVDLYLVDKKIYFGELTNYPLAGRTPFDPISLDFELGSKWKIIPKYWVNY